MNPKEVINEILANLKKNKNNNGSSVLLLSGDLGAGKTTTTKYIAEKLGIDDIVNSPTFVLRKEYETKDFDFKKLIHFDLYRIEKENEIQGIGLPEALLKKETLIVVEWPEKLREGFFKNAVFVNINVEKEERIFDIKNI